MKAPKILWKEFKWICAGMYELVSPWTNSVLQLSIYLIQTEVILPGTLWGGGISLNSLLPRYMAFLSLLPNTNLACYNTLLEQWWSPTKIYLLTQSLTLCFYCCSQYVAVKTLGKYLSRIIEGLDLLLWSISNIIEFFFNSVFVISTLVSRFFQML